MSSKPELNTSDRRMLELIDILKVAGQIRFRQEFCDVIKMPKQNIRQVQQGKQHFTAFQIERACSFFNVNSNWIFDLEVTVFRSAATQKKFKQKLKQTT